MSARTKSPLHPSALSLNDIQPGRRIIRFNRNHGVMGEMVIVSKPYARRWRSVNGESGAKLLVDLRWVDGFTGSLYLTDMGVIPYSGPNSGRRGFWNNVNFTIDARKRHLLPEISPSLPKNSRRRPTRTK
jgi:hypothetical protein